MELISTELVDILTHWENVHKNEAEFESDLKGTGGVKLGRACTSLGLDPPSTKDTAIAAIIKRVKEIDANGGFIPQKRQVVEEPDFEDAAPMVEKRRRGRPPKVKVEDGVEATPEPEKRRRGRPVKAKDIVEPITEPVVEESARVILPIAEEFTPEKDVIEVVAPPETVEFILEDSTPIIPIGAPTGFKILLDETIEKLVPRAMPKNYQTIKHSIENYGWKKEHPLICLPDGTLADGYTRFQILQELEMPIEPDMIEIRDIPADRLKEEIYAINIARRHLSKITEIEWAKAYMPVFKERKRTGPTGPRKKKEELGVDVNPQSTDQSSDSTDTHPSRSEQAKALGIGESQLKEYNWCEKWIPELLEEGKANGDATHTIYTKGQEMKKLCEKHDLWEDVKNGERPFMEAYETAKALEAEVVSSPPVEEPVSTPVNAGPLEKEILLAKQWVIQYFEKRYGFKWENMPQLLEDDVNLLAKFDARAAKHRQKGV